MKNKKLIISVVFIIIVITIFFLINRNKKDSTTNVTDNVVNNIDYSPPTQDEINQGDSIKESQIETPDNNTNDKVVDVVISDASQYGNKLEIRAFVPSVLKKGNCNINLNNGSNSIKKSTVAYPDASSTICTVPTITIDELPIKGVWTVQVEFISDGLNGKSEIIEVNIE